MKVTESKNSNKKDGKLLHSGIAQCQKCPKTIKFQTETRSNLKKHMLAAHSAVFAKFEEAFKGYKFRSKVDEARLKQMSLEESTKIKPKFSQKEAEMRLYEWLSESLRPLSDVECPATIKFLKYLRPEFNLPSRRKVTTNLNKYSVQVLE